MLIWWLVLPVLPVFVAKKERRNSRRGRRRLSMRLLFLVETILRLILCVLSCTG